MTVRLIRVLEYTFEDWEQLGENVKHFAVGMNAVKQFGTNGPIVKSACFNADSIFDQKDIVITTAGPPTNSDPQADVVEPFDNSISLIQKYCTMYDHKPIQHRGNKPPWCELCGRGVIGQKLVDIPESESKATTIKHAFVKGEGLNADLDLCYFPVRDNYICGKKAADH